MTSVAFLGLGTMGLPMAKRLIQAGVAVRGYDPSGDREALFAAAGGTVGAAAAADCAAGADVVLSSLPSPEIVVDTYLGSGGVLAAMTAGGLVVDLSTIGPAAIVRVQQAAAARDIRVADAPVSGSSEGAEIGALTVMVGCHESDYVAVAEQVAPLSRKTVRVGDTGAGQIMKLINNLVAGINMASLIEGCRIAVATGMDPETVLSVISTSSGQSWASEHRFPLPVASAPDLPVHHEFAPGFAAKLLTKDLKLAAVMADESRVTTPLVDLVISQYSQMLAAGGGDKDLSALINYLR